MLKKRDFSYDWTDLSSYQVIENINYLIENFWKYKVTKISENTMKLDDITISYKVEPWTDSDGKTYSVSVVKINNRIIPIIEQGYDEAYELFSKCTQKAKPTKQKISEWYNHNGGKENIYLSLLIAFFVGLGYCGGKSGKKAIKQHEEQYKQEIIQEALDAFKKEQQKTINLNDSINQNVR